MLKYANENENEKSNLEKERSESPSFFDQLSREIPWQHKLLLNKPLKVALVMVAITVIAPTLVFYYLYENIHKASTVTDGFSAGTCGHSVTHRVICGIENATMKQCLPNCCYDEESNICYHYMPSRFSFISRNGWNETKDMNPRLYNTPYNSTKSVPALRLHFSEMSESHLNIVLYDTSKLQFQETPKLQSKKYFYKVFYPEVFIEVYSKEDKQITKPLLTTVRGPLIAAKNIWEWSFHMGDEVVYGMGESILKSNNHKLIYNINGSSTATPFMMSQRNGTFSGLYIELRGPLQINITNSKVVSLKSFSGDFISVHYFFGPRPEDVTRELVKYLGKRDVPPYWALGAHFCRGQGGKTNFTRILENYVNFSTSAQKMPYDSDCISDDLFHYMNFDLNATELDAMKVEISNLVRNNKHFLPSLRPHIKLYNDSEIVTTAVQDGILFLDSNSGDVLEGVVDEDTVYFPDYSLEITASWMKRIWPFSNMADSFILKDNWPRSDANTQNCTVDLPYLTQEINTTFCMSIPWDSYNGLKNTSKHMESHNLYGMNHASAIKNIIQDNQIDGNRNNFILTSSNFISGNVGTSEQNVTTSWETMKRLFRQAVGNSLSGSFVQSIPVCGDTGIFDAQEMEHICLKWYLASVTLPIFRVLSNNATRDPFSFSGYAANVMMNAIKTRYTFLPYYYKYLSENKPLMRPMFYDFYKDNATYLIEDQYMIGDAVMVVPSFASQQPSLHVYIPANETFYDFWDGNKYPSNPTGSWVEIATAETELFMLLRGGHIIAIQEKTELTAEETRLSSSYTIVVGMKCSEILNRTCAATGSLFIANNTYWEFEATDLGLTINPNLKNSRQYICKTSPDDVVISSAIIDKIKVYGLNETQNNFENFHTLPEINFNLCDLKDSETKSFKFL